MLFQAGPIVLRLKLPGSPILLYVGIAPHRGLLILQAAKPGTRTPLHTWYLTLVSWYSTHYPSQSSHSNPNPCPYPAHQHRPRSRLHSEHHVRLRSLLRFPIRCKAAPSAQPHLLALKASWCSSAATYGKLAGFSVQVSTQPHPCHYPCWSYCQLAAPQLLQLELHALPRFRPVALPLRHTPLFRCKLCLACPGAQSRLYPPPTPAPPHLFLEPEALAQPGSYQPCAGPIQ